MLDWGRLLSASFWAAGLAVVLAALGIAYYDARTVGVGLRQRLGTAGFLLPLNLGLGLFCLGLLLSSRAWGERLIWGLFTVVCCAQAIWIWLQQRGPRVRSPGQQPRRKQVHRSTLTAARVGWALALTGLLIFATVGAVGGVSLARHLQSLGESLQHLENVASGGANELGLGDVADAGRLLSTTRQELEAIRAQVGWLLPAGQLLSWLPGVGGELAAATELLQAALLTTTAADRTVQALAPTLPALDGRDSPESTDMGLDQLLPMLVAAQPQLQEAKQELAAATQARSAIDISTLSPRTADLLERFDQYLPVLEMAVDGALLGPALLGAHGPRTYLILAQNNQELRATGGFISGVGEVRIEEGQLAPMIFSDSYAVDNHEVPHELAPPDMQQTLYGELVFFRDANWDPDFPSTARRALAIYARDRGVKADGVVAIDLDALRLLVEAVGPIQVEGIEQPVSGENVLDVIQAQWDKPSGDSNQKWWLHRKDFMGQIARGAMDRVLTGHGVEQARLAQAVIYALEEKHLLLYLSNPQAAEILRTRNWDGALRHPSRSSDTLLVVDSNVGFNKVDPNVDRSIQYQVDLAAQDGPMARLTLTYRNRSRRPVGACIQESRYGETYADMMERCYWNYVRIYAPSGSILQAGPGLPLPAGSLLARNSDAPGDETFIAKAAEGDWSVWTAFFALAPGEERLLTFEYQLPARVLEAGADGLIYYRLRVQKQPGSNSVPLRVEVVPPPDVELADAMLSDLLNISTDLSRDRDFEVVFRRTEGAP